MPRKRTPSPDDRSATSAANRVSRRRFLALIAAAGAALPASEALAATAPRHGKVTPTKGGTVHIQPTPSYVAPPPPSAAIEKGLKEARDSLAGQLKAIRDFDLPAGSEQAFAFRPLRRQRRSS